VIVFEKTAFSRADFCIGSNAQHAVLENDIRDIYEKIFGRAQAHRSGWIDRKQASPQRALAQPHIVCDTPQSAELVEQFVPPGAVHSP
jgi:hypothetical protein